MQSNTKALQIPEQSEMLKNQNMWFRLWAMISQRERASAVTLAAVISDPAPGRHWAMSATSVVVMTGSWGFSWHQVGGSQSCCSAPRTDAHIG